MSALTDNYDFYLPAEHEGRLTPSYHALMNENFTKIDTRLKAHADVLTVTETLPANARTYLKGDGTPEDLAAVTDFVAHTNEVGGCYLPKGNFYMPDGSALFESLAGNITIEGAGRRVSVISTKDAYAIQTPPTDNVDDVVIRNLGTELRAGSTVGGGIKAVSAPGPNSYHSGWEITCVEGFGAATCVQPVIHVDGWIGSYADLIMVAGCGGDGISIARDSFPSNAWGLSRFRVAVAGLAGNTYAAVRISGVLGQVGPGIIESNRCYGLVLNGSNVTVGGVHFEDQFNTDIYGEMAASTIERCQFHFHDAGVAAGARHIHMLCTAGPHQRHMNRILNNQIADAAASGVNLEIGTNVEDTLLDGNRGLGFAAGIIDNGTRTVSYQTDNENDAPGEMKLPPTSVPRFRIKGTTQTGDNGDFLESGIFAAVDSLNEEKVGVTRSGHLAQATPNGDPGTGKLPTDAFSAFWDETAQRVRMRVRDHTGNTFVQEVSRTLGAANANTSGATLAALETEVNELKAALRSAGVIAP